MLIDPGGRAPDPWAGAPRYRIDRLSDGDLEKLEEHYLRRIPSVLELSGDVVAGEETCTEAPWSLGPGFSFPGERLAHLLTANSIDTRSPGLPRWRAAGLAVGLGAGVGGAEVVLPDGTAAYCDGGPLQIDLAPDPAASIVHRIVLEHGSLAPLGSNECRADLAPDQLAAVTHPGGAARIIAPAGSGKTRVLTERARHLVRSWRLPPAMLCLVAFNRRAAEEMTERTADLPGLRVRTLNSLALAIAGGTGAFGGQKTTPTIDERAVREILDGLVTFPRRMSTDPAAAWIEALSAVRLGLRPPKEVEAEFNGDADGLPEVFERYREVLRRRGVLDFDDQIYSAIELLLSDPAARQRARRSCRIMLVDEFQDLTPAHLLLIRLLAGPDGYVYGVGDDDQTIYGYSDASPDWLIDYSRFFPGAGWHQLEVNYRCPPRVVQAARTLLTHNFRRVGKSIRAAPGRSEGDRDLAIAETQNPVATTLNVVKALLEDGYATSDIAVLTRVNHSLAPVQIALREAAIPVVQAVDEGYLQRTGVRAALAWLRIAGRPRLRGTDVASTARRPPRALSPTVVEWMAEQRNLAGLRSLAERLGDRDATKVGGYADDLEMLTELRETAPLAEVLEALRDRVGLAEAIEPLDLAHRRLDRSPQTDDLNVLVELARLCPESTDFERWLSEGLSRPSDPAGLMLATVHSVKGREWEQVIVHHATEGLMPHRLAGDVEEERRVFHVALTRCRTGVTVVAGSPPSRFLSELTKPWVAPPQRAIPAPGPAEPALSDIVPVVGMRVVAGGYSGIVTGIEARGVIARVDSSTTVIPFGKWVEAEGLWGRFVSPGSSAPEAADKVVTALKAWRLEKARSEGKPAYVFLHDSTIEAVAASGARTLQDLARVKGIGPAKLESFGDELLAVIEPALADDRE